MSDVVSVASSYAHTHTHTFLRSRWGISYVGRKFDSEQDILVQESKTDFRQLLVLWAGGLLSIQVPLTKQLQVMVVQGFQCSYFMVSSNLECGVCNFKIHSETPKVYTLK